MTEPGARRIRDDDSDELDLDAQLERLDEDDDAPVTLDVYDSELAWRPPDRERNRRSSFSSAASRAVRQPSIGIP